MESKSAKKTQLKTSRTRSRTCEEKDLSHFSQAGKTKARERAEEKGGRVITDRQPNGKQPSKGESP